MLHSQSAMEDIIKEKDASSKEMVVHNEMECDSMHSAISTEFKKVDKANWPEDWTIIAKCARRKGDKPYIVHNISHKDILDWKTHAEKNMIFRKEDENKNTIKENFDEDFRILNCIRTASSRSSIADTLKLLYPNKLPIKKDKYNDLLSLFQMNPSAISNECKSYFVNLPFKGEVCSESNHEPSDSESNDTG
ncbi:hypothetical protein ABEB36_013837 [Hypothenemus hampei]|uniref:Uncharacterized protein n=1 Tax=Hypothenemus hampei TaxID=57062 RepID=A0ABD1E9X7_HYPHA